MHVYANLDEHETYVYYFCETYKRLCDFMCEPYEYFCEFVIIVCFEPRFLPSTCNVRIALQSEKRLVIWKTSSNKKDIVI